MCVDFTNLNKACLKECYPLPRIDQLVDSTSGHTTLCFSEAFSGYHQVFLKEQNQPKCAFITTAGVYMYMLMSFGLKNDGATYQRLMDEVFREQKGKTSRCMLAMQLSKASPMPST
ncbi:hypothetical protein vseg_007577 [Gypsophila vaccaria]